MGASRLALAKSIYYNHLSTTSIAQTKNGKKFPFQVVTPILVKEFFIFLVLEKLTGKHSFVYNRVL